MRVALRGLGDRALSLAQRPLEGLRHPRQRLPQGADQECVRLVLERERGRFARGKTTPPAAAEKPCRVLCLSAGGADCELRHNPRGQQELQAKREPSWAAPASAGSAFQIMSLIGQQPEHPEGISVAVGTPSH